MPSVGVLTLDIHIEAARSLKDKRQFVRTVKDRLRKRLNVAVAELDGQGSWQRAVIGVVTISPSQSYAAQTLTHAEAAAEQVLGRALVSTSVEFL